MGYDTRKNCPAKIVIRRLPPKLTEKEFLNIVSPIPSHSDFRFCSVDDSLGSLGFTRVYITFCDVDSLFDFKERFDNYVFVDSEGNESCAQIEFAVCQSLASSKDPNATNKHPKADRKQGTIQDDPEFINFVKNLEQTETGTESADGAAKKMPWEEILEEIQNKDTIQQTKATTPLLAYINQNDLDGRKDDEALRQGKQKRGKLPKKNAKSEKHVRSHATTRRPQEPKRNVVDHAVLGQSIRDKANQNKGEDNLIMAPSKSQKEVVLDAEEFPAMQGSTQYPVKPIGSWSDRMSVWQINSEGLSKTSTKYSTCANKTKGKNSVEQSIESNAPGNVYDESNNVETVQTHFEDKSEKVVNYNSSDLRYVDSSSVRDAMHRSKKVHYPVRIASNPCGQNRKTAPTSLHGRRDCESRSCNYTNCHYDDQDSEYVSDHYGSYQKHSFRGRDSRHGPAADSGLYIGCTRDNYRSGQQTSRDGRSARSYDYAGDRSWTDYNGGSSRQGTPRGSCRSRAAATAHNRTRRQAPYDSRN